MGLSNLSSGFRPGVCTSTTRPSAPFEGQMIYETDTDKMLVWGGSSWLYITTPQTTEPGVWTSYTPTLTQSGAVTKTVTYAEYTQIGKTCLCNVRLDVTGTGTGNNAVEVGLPLTASTTTISIGNAAIYDTSTSTAYHGACYVSSTTTLKFWGDWSATSFWGVTPNLALASGDQIHLAVQYEVA